MFCEKCGKKLEDGVKFCPSCGNRVEIPENQQREPGMITAVDKKSFTIQCNPGGLRVTQLQLEGKKRMNTDAFLLGFAVEEGMRCGKQTQE